MNNFFYYLFRNTTYLFFKHFGFHKAAKFTLKAIYRQLKLIKINQTGLSRDYLKITSKRKAVVSVITGSLSGFYSLLKNNEKKLGLLCSEPSSINCFKVILISSSLKLIEIEGKTHFIKKLFGL